MQWIVFFKASLNRTLHYISHQWDYFVYSFIVMLVQFNFGFILNFQYELLLDLKWKMGFQMCNRNGAVARDCIQTVPRILFFSVKFWNNGWNRVWYSLNTKEFLKNGWSTASARLHDSLKMQKEIGSRMSFPMTMPEWSWSQPKKTTLGTSMHRTSRWGPCLEWHRGCAVPVELCLRLYSKNTLVLNDCRATERAGNPIPRAGWTMLSPRASGALALSTRRSPLPPTLLPGLGDHTSAWLENCVLPCRKIPF